MREDTSGWIFHDIKNLIHFRKSDATKEIIQKRWDRCECKLQINIWRPLCMSYLLILRKNIENEQTDG